MDRELDGQSLHPGGLRLSDRAARLSGLTGGMRVADVGCGNGATLRYLSARYSITGTGIDFSGELIARNREAAPQIDFICGDAVYLPVEEARFDAVLCECVLSETSDRKQVIRWINSALRPGGKLILSDICSKKTVPELLTTQELTALISGSGFEILIEEDHTPALVTYAAERFQSGCAGFGYLLVIARKQEAGDSEISKER